jgi:uncharacterized BrkB/YihY/UPF0761 family membrane protein
MEPTAGAAARTAADYTALDGLVVGLIGYGLTIVVALAAAGFIWLVVAVLERMKKKPQAAPAVVSVAVVPEATAQDETARHVAAIAAAVYAALGAHRLVYIGEAAGQPAWRTTGRVLHHSSHMPKRSPQR